MNDFLSFRKMITPTIIQALFWIGVVLCVLAGVIMLLMGIFAHGEGVLALAGLMYIVIGPVMVRIYCELLILFFRMLDELMAIRGALTGTMPGNAFPVQPATPVAPGAVPPGGY